jgi:hypothetical protein
MGAARSAPVPVEVDRGIKSSSKRWPIVELNSVDLRPLVAVVTASSVFGLVSTAATAATESEAGIEAGAVFFL